MNASKLELYAIIKGRVQGVGFRWTVQDHAMNLGLPGQVRNLPNGSVEVVAQGTKEDLCDLLNLIKAEPGSASIDTIETEYRPLTSSLSVFKIFI